MKNHARLLLSALLLLPLSTAFASGVVSPVDFDGIRRVSPFEPIKYRVDDSGRANLPTSPPNLTRAQMERVAAAMMGRTGAAAAPTELIYRVVNIMARTDMSSGAPITRQDWDRRIAAFERGYAADMARGATRSPDDVEKIVDGLIREMVKAPQDPHTQYMSRAELRQFMERQRNTGFVGIGAHVSPDPAGVKIARPLPNSPSTTAVLRQNGRDVAVGLKKDDLITAIDRVPAAGMPLDAAVQRLRGVPGTTVEVRIKRGSQEYTAVITRAHVSTPNSFAKFAAPGVGYIHFAAFLSDTDKEVFAHIDRLKARGARKLILDVRGNPGGSMAAVQSIASEFLRDKQEITTTRTQGIVIERAIVDGDGMYKDIPVAVLIDSGSASASEILAAVLQDYARGKIVGWQSYGKGTYQTVLPTEIPVERLGMVVGNRQDGTAVKITGGGWFTPRGTSIDGRHDAATGRNVPGSGGVVPDVTVNVSNAEQEAVMEGLTEQLYGSGPAAAYDPALGAAVDALNRP